MLLMLTFSDFQLSLQIAVFAAVFSEILIREGNLFERYGFWLDKLPTFWAKPLGYCAACFAGQIGFWSFLVLEFEFSLEFAARLVSFSSLSILSAFLLSALIRAARRQ